MKKIILILLSLLLVSCNTTKRAEKRIYNIVENHQELLKQDTVKIDTTFVITPDDDSVTFRMEEITEEPKIIRSETGNFVITRLPSKEVKIIYLPDTMEVNYRDSKVYDKIVIQEPPQKWRDVLFACIIGFVGLLFLKLFFERLMK
ncbi:MAG: hypothetical protein UHK44_07775 [Bacteroidaceae bacterium]|nr:hypothetical protein [Bacteroidaceae bacterium]